MIDFLPICFIPFSPLLHTFNINNGYILSRMWHDWSIVAPRLLLLIKHFSDNRHRTSSCYLSTGSFSFSIINHSMLDAMTRRWPIKKKKKKRTCKRDNFVKTESAIIAWNSIRPDSRSTKDDNRVCINSPQIQFLRLTLKFLPLKIRQISIYRRALPLFSLSEYKRK